MTINLKLALECSAATDSDSAHFIQNFRNSEPESGIYAPFLTGNLPVHYAIQNLKLIHSFTVGRILKSILIKKEKEKGCKKFKGKRASRILADAAVDPNLRSL